MHLSLRKPRTIGGQATTLYSLCAGLSTYQSASHPINISDLIWTIIYFFSFSLEVDEADFESYGDIEGEDNDIPEMPEALEETGGLLAEEPEASEVPEPETELG